ncbi:DNA-binding protein [Candidatus Kaiserbacteria bacterium]|nr:DNA-binding protein [Candidatus Kaiserbacteria bacterium]
MRQLSFRIKEGELFRESIEKRCAEAGVEAGVILSAVGGFQKLILRMPILPNQEKHTVKELEGPFEIVSINGTISPNDCHIHVSASDQDGVCIGGHLKEGTTVKNTAEVVIGVFDDVVFERNMDGQTGYKEFDPKTL